MIMFEKKAESMNTSELLFYIEKCHAEIDRLADALSDAMEALGEAHGRGMATGDGWISVEDWLPENGDYITSNCNSGFVCVAHFSSLGKGFSIAHVTHWQPLPSPPRPPARKYRFSTCGEITAAEVAQRPKLKAAVLELARELENVKL